MAIWMVRQLLECDHHSVNRITTVNTKMEDLNTYFFWTNDKTKQNKNKLTISRTWAKTMPCDPSHSRVCLPSQSKSPLQWVRHRLRSGSATCAMLKLAQKHSQSQTNEKRRKRKQQIKKEEHELTFAQGANVVIHLLTTEPAHRIKEVGVILFTIH